ncbi:hypothetical protein BCR32DRAFT_237972 [Anaeromyces robustus]|uniref:C2H2-type domain-containing protein n=1 Tax=Anaeromyces robustus TaxID=1754192 RepID=A0A1Y1W5U1_9FUNG|nr:hypothetical protein BCR32DRAFT_237972 [Anaeromyces robustus]|eukprot:ORX68899.1 hypothetical protein BCR32DRAFT_237972 [Anaeromyces robustus]
MEGKLKKNKKGKDEIQEFVDDFLMDAFLTSKEIELEHHKDLFTAPAFDSENNFDQFNVSNLHLFKKQNNVDGGNNRNLISNKKSDSNSILLPKIKSTSSTFNNHLSTSPAAFEISNSLSPLNQSSKSPNNNKYLSTVSQTLNNRMLSPLEDEKNLVLSPMGINAAMFLATNSMNSRAYSSNKKRPSISSIPNNSPQPSINSPYNTTPIPTINSNNNFSTDSITISSMDNNSAISYNPEININIDSSDNNNNMNIDMNMNMNMNASLLNPNNQNSQPTSPFIDGTTVNQKRRNSSIYPVPPISEKITHTRSRSLTQIQTLPPPKLQISLDTQEPLSPNKSFSYPNLLSPDVNKLTTPLLSPHLKPTTQSLSLSPNNRSFSYPNLLSPDMNKLTTPLLSPHLKPTTQSLSLSPNNKSFSYPSLLSPDINKVNSPLLSPQLNSTNHISSYSPPMSTLNIINSPNISNDGSLSPHPDILINDANLVSSPRGDLLLFNMDGHASPVSDITSDIENETRILNSVLLKEYNEYIPNSTQNTLDTKKTPSIIVTPSTSNNIIDSNRNTIVFPAKENISYESNLLGQPLLSESESLFLRKRTSQNIDNEKSKRRKVKKNVNDQNIELISPDNLLNHDNINYNDPLKEEEYNINNEMSNKQTKSKKSTKRKSTKEKKIRTNKKQKTDNNKDENENTYSSSNIDSSISNNDYNNVNDDDENSKNTKDNDEKSTNTHNGRVIKHPRIFECKFEGCNKAFTKAHNLRSHERSHMNNRPYGCKYCEKRFVRQYDLLRHERIHTGFKPYVCKKCFAAFSRNDAYNKHIRSCLKKE